MNDIAYYAQKATSWWPERWCVTPWLRRLLWVPLIVLVGVAAVMVYWAFDRVEPVTVVSQPIVPQVRAGERVFIAANVERHYGSDNCEVTIRRHIVTSAGFRVFEDEERRTTTGTLLRVSEQHPGELRTSIMVPPGIPPGPSRLVSDLEYRCNILQHAWPTRTSTVLLFDVVP